MTRLPDVWGATGAEVARTYPADTVLDPPVRRLTRAVTVAAPPGHVYRWLRQLAIAPYSYDWIDNRGRRSPRRLVPEAGDVEAGQVMMRTYEVVAVEPGRSWTGVMLPQLTRMGSTTVPLGALVHDLCTAGSLGGAQIVHMPGRSDAAPGHERPARWPRSVPGSVRLRPASAGGERCATVDR